MKKETISTLSHSAIMGAFIGFYWFSPFDRIALEVWNTYLMAHSTLLLFPLWRNYRERRMDPFYAQATLFPGMWSTLLIGVCLAFLVSPWYVIWMYSFVFILSTYDLAACVVRAQALEGK